MHIYDVGEIEGNLFMATQLIDGPDLHDLIRREGPLGPADAVDVLLQLCVGIEDAHDVGVVHRDIKPSNVLVRRRRGAFHAFLCDFGIATTRDTAMTRTGTMVGSPAYMAPERHHGAPAETSGDVYSLGCLLWALLTGRPPYSGSELQVAQQHLSAPMPQVPAAAPWADVVNEVLRRSMAKDPVWRYAGAAELAADLARIDRAGLTDAPVVAVPARPDASEDAPLESPTVFGERTIVTRVVPGPAAATGTEIRPFESVPGSAVVTSSPTVPVPGPAFTQQETAAVEGAIARARRHTGFSFSLFVGRSQGAVHGFALDLHGQLLAPPESLLIVIDPFARAFEVVTGARVRARLDDAAVQAVVAEMVLLFARGELAEGLVHGIAAMARRMV